MLCYRGFATLVKNSYGSQICYCKLQKNGVKIRKRTKVYSEISQTGGIMPFEFITGKDWNQVLDAVYQTNSATDMDTFAKAVFSQLYLLIPHEKSMIVKLAEADGTRLLHAEHVASHGMDDASSYGFPAFSDDPYLDAISTRTHPSAFLDSEVYSEERKVAEGIYQTFYQPHGVHYVMRISLTDKDVVIGQVNLYRMKSSGDFTEKDVVLGMLLSRHLSLKFSTLIKHTDGLVLEEQDGEVEKKLHDAYGLSHRECQIATMIAQGMTDQEIADTLVISLSTVKKHVYNAYAKLGVNKRVQLVRALAKL